MRQILNYNVYYEDDAYRACVQVDYHIDANFGADADGSRGYRRTIVDDARVVSAGLDGSNLIEIPEGLINAILACVEDHL